MHGIGLVQGRCKHSSCPSAYRGRTINSGDSWNAAGIVSWGCGRERVARLVISMYDPPKGSDECMGVLVSTGTLVGCADGMLPE